MLGPVATAECGGLLATANSNRATDPTEETDGRDDGRRRTELRTVHYPNSHAVQFNASMARLSG